MAQKVLVSLEDDLDGTEAEETVIFGLDGVDYEIDLNGDNAARLRDVLADFVDCARRTGGRVRKSKPVTGRSTTNNTAVAPATQPAKVAAKVDREQTRAIRNWANSHGYEVGDRGRIPQHIVDAYHNNHAA